MNIKICGMKYHDNIIDVSMLLPQYMGFIFYDKSPRNYTQIDIPNLPISIKKVGVFYGIKAEAILKIIEHYRFDYVQLYDDVSVADCQYLKDKGVSIIKSFSVTSSLDTLEIKKYTSIADFFLFDTKGKLPGGNGITFDWIALKNYDIDKPFFVAGGIGLEQINAIQELLAQTKLPIHALDINSKFEDVAGLKNINKLKNFIGNIQ